MTFAIWRAHIRHITQGRLHAIKASGLPTSGPELNDYYQAVPDGQNAALIMTQAFALIRTYPDKRSNQIALLSFPPRGQHLNPDAWKLVAGYVEMNSNAIETARMAVSRKRCRYDSIPGGVENRHLTHLGPLRRLASLVAWQAVLYAEDGRGADAARDIRLIVSLAGTLEREPIAISQRVRVELLKTGATGCEQILNRTSLDQDSARDLEHAFANAFDTNSLVQSLIGERAADIFYYFQGEGWWPTDRVSQLTMRVVRSSGFFERDLQPFLDAVDTNLAFATRGPPETLKLDSVNQQLSARQEPVAACCPGFSFPWG